MSDPEKITALAKIAGWSDIQDYDQLGFRPVGSPPDGGPRRQVPDYLCDANAVIALLEKQWYWVSDNGGLKVGHGHEYILRVGRIGHKEGAATDPNFCRAACLALLSAYGGA